MWHCASSVKLDGAVIHAEGRHYRVQEKVQLHKKTKKLASLLLIVGR
jgi:hypothetical protein